MDRKTRQSSGFSLTEVLVATAIFAGVVLGALSVFKSYKQAVSLGERLGQEEDLRNHIRRSVDCTRTVQNEEAACKSCGGKLVAGYTKGGAKYVTNKTAGRTFGDYNVKLYCKHAEGGYDLYAQVKKNGDAAYKDLFEVPIACKSSCGYNPGGPDQETIGTGNPTDLPGIIAAEATKCGVASPSTFPARRSTGATGGGGSWNDDGVEDLPTLKRVCNLLGFGTYVRSTCQHVGDPHSKCNWWSPHDNALWSWNGTSSSNHYNPPKYEWTWLSTITCKDKGGGIGGGGGGACTP
jgi:prepilin-type N-terminal cleavage/methylation domain-containing protein